MKNYHSTLASFLKCLCPAIILCVVGCTKIWHEADSHIKPTTTLEVNVEKVDETQSVINFNSTFKWSNGDCIGAYGASTNNSCFSLQSDEDDKVIFSGSIESSEDTPLFAYYPYHESTEYKNNSLTFDIPKTFNVTNEISCPMLGHFVDNAIDFKYLGGLINIRIEGMDKSASKLIISSEGEESHNLTGKAIVDNINESGCIYHIESGSNEVVYDLETIADEMDCCQCYVPMPVGEYDKILIKVTNNDNESIAERYVYDVTISRAQMLSVPTMHLNGQLYMYNLPEEWLINTDWDGGFLLSNFLFVAYKNEGLAGGYYIFSDLLKLDKTSSENQNIITAQFDEQGRILYASVGNVFYDCTYDEGNCQVNVSSGSNHSTYTKATSSTDRLLTKSSVDSEHLSALNMIRDFLDNPFVSNDNRSQSTRELIKENARIIERTLQNWFPSGRNPLSGVDIAVNLIYAHTKQVKVGNYEHTCGNASVTMNLPKKVSSNYYEIGYTINNSNDILNNNEFAGNIESGFIIRKLPLESADGNSNKNLFKESSNVKVYDFPDAQSKSRGLRLEPGMCYYVRAYLGSPVYEVYSYSDEVYEIKYENPLCHTGAASNITATSAVINCQYTNIPENGRCKVMLTWNNNTDSRVIDAENSEEMQSIIIDNLIPDTSYSYYAYIDYEGEPIIGETKEFKTKPINLTLKSISYDDDYYYYTKDNNGYVAYDLTAKISGNTDDIGEFQSCGIYLWNSEKNESRIWHEGLSGAYNNTPINMFIGVPESNFDKRDDSRYYAEATKYYFGVYVQFNDGSYYMCDPVPCKFVYNRKPSYRYTSVGPISVSVVGSEVNEDGETIIEYNAEHAVSYFYEGVFWIDSIQSWCEGGTWEFTDTGEKYAEPWTPTRDIDASDSSRSLHYWSTSDMYHSVWKVITTKSGETLSSNSLVYGGSPENPTVSIGGARTYASSIASYPDKSRLQFAGDTRNGSIEMVLLEDTHEAKDNVLSIDQLKVLNNVSSMNYN